jgi:acyl-coenzyme A thioesterase PaaI-like protein
MSRPSTWQAGKSAPPNDRGRDNQDHRTAAKRILRIVAVCINWKRKTGSKTASGLGTEPHRHESPAPYPHCYGCGAENPVGLQLDFEFDGKELLSRFTPLDHHQGYPGIVHGGVISSLLYEVMANINRYTGDDAVLRSTEVRFRRPIPVNKPIVVTARVVEETSSGWDLAANIINESGDRLASATGEAIRPKQ